jgi:hypothetical protein
MRDPPARWIAAASEAAGLAAVAVLAVLVLVHLSSSARGILLYADGDSVLLQLVRASLAEGARQDWAMSSVLFGPELAGFLALGVLGLPPAPTMAVYGVCSLVLLYAALRVLAWAGMPHAARRLQIGGAVLAFAALAAASLTESAAGRDGFELASLQAFGTYYGATTVGAVLALAALARAARGTGVFASVALGLVAAVSTASNPLFLVWFTVPAVLALAVLALTRRAPGRHLLLPAATTLIASGVGLLARVPLADHILESGVGYVHVDRMGSSLGYYGDHLGERVSEPAGVAEAALALALLVIAVVLAVRAFRGRESGALLVTTWGVLVALGVLVGGVVAGTNATRYLIPVLLGPLAALVVAPALVPSRGRRRFALSAVTALGVVAVTGAVTADRTSGAETTASVACVADWVDRETRTGAGEFWTIRAAKAYSRHPSRLVQVRADLSGYAWLVNRADFEADTLSYLVTEGDTPLLEYANAITPAVASHECGNYTITEFGGDGLPLLPPHG